MLRLFEMEKKLNRLKDRSRKRDTRKKSRERSVIRTIFSPSDRVVCSPVFPKPVVKISPPLSLAWSRDTCCATQATSRQKWLRALAILNFWEVKKARDTNGQDLENTTQQGAWEISEDWQSVELTLNGKKIETYTVVFYRNIYLCLCIPTRLIDVYLTSDLWTILSWFKPFKMDLSPSN